MTCLPISDLSTLTNCSQLPLELLHSASSDALRWVCSVRSSDAMAEVEIAIPEGGILVASCLRINSLSLQMKSRNNGGEE